MKRYNKSEIMKNAHRIYRCTFNITFGQALKKAWKIAKDAVAYEEYSKARYANRSEAWKRQDEQLNRLYSNVTFGRNDWAVDYGRRYRF